ncbi:hypothetical protein J2S74_004541 [Evansella vedderi]|uniref:Uncharacterized protein n=1 Tax=Evansella vedderi TaxID=38282 RepID=A0ABU0A431_9BACI|nr:three component ABC system middle component [Evansella vedderi]MDQ0257095.1 hypothetical protein [Evansella vedderi]
MISTDIYSSTNPALCSIVLWSFLKGFEEQNKDGCEFPIILLTLPISLSNKVRETFKGTSNATGLLTWLSRGPQSLIGLPQRIETSSSFTKDAIIFGINNKIIDIDNKTGKLKSNNSGLTQSKLNNILKSEKASELKDIMLISKRFGNWCGQLQSSIIIYNVMGLSL